MNKSSLKFTYKAVSISPKRDFEVLVKFIVNPNEC